MNLQEEILEIFFKEKAIDTDEKQRNFLKNLKTKKDKLFKNFKSDHVKVDYCDENIQFLFVLIYFPFHAQILPIILKDLLSRKIFSPLQNMKISFIGCGPGAEILGFFNFLKSQSISYPQININTFDKHSQDWQFWLNHNFKKWIASIYNGNIDKKNSQFDLTLSLNDDQKFEDSNLIVLQNTLSEIHENDHEMVAKNLVEILDRTKKGGAILIIDFKYQAIFNLLNLFINKIFEKDNIETIENKRKQEYDGIKIKNAMPEIIKGTLFEDTKKRRINYFYLMIKKYSDTKEKSFTFSKPFMNEHYKKIKSILDKEGIEIEDVKEIQHALKYTFKDEEKSCIVNFWYKKEGRFSKNQKEEGDGELWKKIEELL